jgi:hypothetical protein
MKTNILKILSIKQYWKLTRKKRRRKERENNHLKRKLRRKMGRIQKRHLKILNKRKKILKKKNPKDKIRIKQ